MHPLGELSRVVGGAVEGQAYVAVAAQAFDAQGEAVAVDGQRPDPDGAVQAVLPDEPGQALDGVGMGVGEVGEQVRLGGDVRVGRGRGELLGADEDGPGVLLEHDAGGVQREAVVLGVNQPTSQRRARTRWRTGTGATSANSSTACGSPRGAQSAAVRRALSGPGASSTRPSSVTVCAPTNSSRAPSAVTAQDHAAASTDRARSAVAGMADQL